MTTRFSIPRSLAAYGSVYNGFSWADSRGSRSGPPRLGSMYMNIGKAAYKVSTGDVRLNMTISSISIKRFLDMDNRGEGGAPSNICRVCRLELIVIT